MIQGTASAAPLKSGGRRLVIRDALGAEIGIDLSPEAAASLSESLAVAPAPDSDDHPTEDNAAPAHKRPRKK